MYKMIDNLEKLCGRLAGAGLAGAGLTHRTLISETLAERYRDRLPEGQKYPDVFQLQTFIGEDLQSKHVEVVGSETGLIRELTEDRLGRDARDSSLSGLREQLLAARKIFDAIFGPGGSDVIFMKANSFVHIDPVPLHRQGVIVHDNLLDDDFKLPALRLDVGVDLPKLARDLEPNLQQLEEMIQELRLSTRSSDESLAATETAIADMDGSAGLSARLLEALCYFAGHPGVARRIRQSYHASSDKSDSSEPEAAEAPGEDEESEEGSSSDDASAAEPAAATSTAERPLR